MTHASASLSDETLAARAQAGERAAFEALVRRYQAPAMRFLQRRFGRQAEAEDVLQESFLRAYQRLHQFDPQRSFRAWFFTILHRIALRHVESQPDARPIPASLGSADPALNAMTDAEQRENLWDIARRLLSGEQFSVLWLYYVEETPTAEIARMLGRSIPAIKTMLHRARQQLRPALRDGDGQPSLSIGAV